MIRPGIEKGAFRARWKSEACILAADSRAALVEHARRVRQFISAFPEISLRDFAFSLGGGTDGGDFRLAIVASSTEDLAKKLAYADDRLSDPECGQIKDRSGIYFFTEPLARTGRVAFLFPGEGSQYVNMLTDLCLHFPEVRKCFDVADRAFASHERGYVPSQFLFPKPGRCEPAGGDSRLWQMDGAVEAVFTANLALRRLLTLLEVHPDVVMGHSTGEYSALMAAGAVTLEDNQHLISMMQDLNSLYVSLADNGQIPEAVLMAVGAARHDAVTSLLEEHGDGLYLAMDNCPHQVVLCGDEAAIARAEEELRRGGAVCERLRFNRPYHTPLFQQVCGPLEEFFSRLPMTPPEIEIYSCASAGPVPADVEEIRALGVAQWALPVRFREAIEEMYRNDVRVFVEVGPRGNLSAFVSDTLRGRPHLAVPIDVPSRSGIDQLNHLVALLSAHCVPLRTDRLFQGRGCSKLDFDASDPEPKGARQAVMSMSSSLPALQLKDPLALKRSPSPAAAPRADVPSPTVQDRPTTIATGAEEGAAVAAPAPSNGRARVLQDYLRTHERLLDTQRRVTLAFLERAAVLSSQGSVAAAPTAAGLAGRRVVPTVEPGAAAHPTEMQPGEMLPIIGEVISHAKGRSLVTRFVVTLDEHPYLRHHTLGSRVSADDPDLTALPLVMLTMAMEFMVQAAVRLIPGSVVAGMTDILAHRWIALTRDRLVLEVQAERDPEHSPDSVRVTLRDVGTPVAVPAVAAAGPSATLLEAHVLLAGAYPEAPAPETFALVEERQSRWAPDELYSKVMFHGPKLQGVMSVDRWSREGAEMTLLALPGDGMFGAETNYRFYTDPVLLDAAGQVVGFWTAEHLESGFTVFPFRVAEVRFFGPAIEPGQKLKCHARLTLSGTSYVRADFDVVRSDGRLQMLVKGWEDKRIPLSDEFFRFRFSPADIILSRCQRPVGSETGDGVTSSLEFPDRLMETEGRIWREGLAHLILSRRERSEWFDLTGSEDERTRWMLERAAAKDAVRFHLTDRYGVKVCPADIETSPGPGGRLLAGGSWASGAGGSVAVSTFSSNGAAGAAVVDEMYRTGTLEAADEKKGVEI